MPHNLKQLDFIIEDIKTKSAEGIPKTIVFSDDIKEVQTMYFWAHGKLTTDKLYSGEPCVENR